MSYDYEKIASYVQTRLERTPQTTMSELLNELAVHRHTVVRALRAVLGTTFRELKNGYLKVAIEKALSDGTARPIKEAANQAGYSSGSALARRVRKFTGRTPSDIRRTRRRSGPS